MGQNRARPGGGLDQEGSQNRARPGGRVHSRFVRARTDWGARPGPGPHQRQGPGLGPDHGQGQGQAQGHWICQDQVGGQTRWGARTGPGPGARARPQTSAADLCRDPLPLISAANFFSYLVAKISGGG